MPKAEKNPWASCDAIQHGGQRFVAVRALGEVLGLSYARCGMPLYDLARVILHVPQYLERKQRLGYTAHLYGDATQPDRVALIFALGSCWLAVPMVRVKDADQAEAQGWSRSGA